MTDIGKTRTETGIFPFKPETAQPQLGTTRALRSPLQQGECSALGFQRRTNSASSKYNEAIRDKLGGASVHLRYYKRAK